jgi:hypothetical protein
MNAHAPKKAAPSLLYVETCMNCKKFDYLCVQELFICYFYIEKIKNFSADVRKQACSNDISILMIQCSKHYATCIANVLCGAAFSKNALKINYEYKINSLVGNAHEKSLAEFSVATNEYADKLELNL